MTEQSTTPSNEDEGYRKELLDRCALLGITVSPLAKNDTIAAKIAAVLKDDKPADEVKPDISGAPAPNPMVEPVPQDAKKAKELHPAKRLKRVIVTCNDPQKADQSGDIVSVSNGEVGDIRFYVHFGKPWHIPQIILDTLKDSTLFLHSSRKDGREVITRQVPRYNIQELPALDDNQRKRIEDKQAAALATED